ncbi:MAG: hypothetical protein CL878_06450 [Dehalococcoidia bacterium]|nr:hypothetical protein [Dehalococcoidia bacterium]
MTMLRLNGITAQVQAVLRIIQRADQTGTVDRLESSTLLDAARSFWLMGRLPLAQRFYGQVGPRLLADARSFGDRSGNYGAYALVALGAAWAAGAGAARVKLRRDIEEDISHRLATTTESILRAGLELNLIRTAWIAREYDQAQQRVRRLEGHVTRMQKETRGHWESERGNFAAPVYSALLAKQAQQAGRTLERLEQFLLAGVSPPLSVVDEEFVYLARAVADLDVDMSQFRLPYEPGLITRLETAEE